MRHISSTALPILASLALAASAARADVTVNQVGLTFQPRDVTIAVGETVTWIWSSGSHTVTEGTDGTVNGDEAFHSMLNAGTTSYAVTFDAAFLAANPRVGNLYDYFCAPHFALDMKGTVTVFEPTTYCTGKTTSEGCQPYMDFNGIASVTSTGPFKVISRDTIDGTVGIWIYSDKKGALIAHHGGFFCVKAPLRRTAAKVAKSPSGGVCGTATGRHTIDFQNLIQSGSDPALTAGRDVFIQGRFRDVADPAGFGDGLTNGMKFTIEP